MIVYDAKKLVVLGSTAYPEISELIRDINEMGNKYRVIEILDDNENLYGSEIEGVKIDGPLEKVSTYSDEIQFVFSIGSYKTRLRRHDILKRLNLPDHRFETLIHPSTKIYSSSTIGNGVIIHNGTMVFNNTTIGPLSIIVANTIIGARNIIGKCAIITSLVATTTDVKIGSFAFIGTHTSIAEYVEIGPGAMIGMGSLINRDVPPGAVVFGSPFKIIDKVDVPKEIIEDWNIQKGK